MQSTPYPQALVSRARTPTDEHRVALTAQAADIAAERIAVGAAGRKDRFSSGHIFPTVSGREWPRFDFHPGQDAAPFVPGYAAPLLEEERHASSPALLA